MKKAVFALAAAIAAATVALFPACSDADGNAAGTFCFLSVRLKGNGDGTVTAVAINEFNTGGTKLPVTLCLYRSEEYEENTQDMQLLETAESDGLAMNEKIEIVCSADAGGYFCALAEYTINGETRQIFSDMVHYSAEGTRL